MSSEQINMLTPEAPTDPEADALRDAAEGGVWRFSIYGKPVAKDRHRVDPRSGRMYTPEKTRTYEKTVADIGRMRLPKGWPTDALYRLEIDAYCKNLNELVDADNMKTVCDGLQGIAFKNDKQVRDYRCRTHVVSGPNATTPGEELRIDIVLEVMR